VESLKRLVRVVGNQLTFDGIAVFQRFSPQLSLFLLIVVPSLMILLLYRALLVRSGRTDRLLPRRLLLNLAIACTLLGVLLITLTARPYGSDGRTDLIPFHPLWNALTGEIDATRVVATFGANILLFVPIGILLPVRWPRLDRAGVVTLMTAGLSAAIEVAQYFMNAGRVAQLDDVIFNTLGGLIGWAMVRAVRLVRPAPARP
jgi:glycopeptide antibiotics resistance protein